MRFATNWQPKEFCDSYIFERKSMSSEDITRFENLIGELSRHPKSLQMKDFIQHGKRTTYDHCIAVSRMSYRIGKYFNVDRKSLVKGAFLHDYFLYDWHEKVGTHHGKMHPFRALANAERDFELNEKEKGIIKCHMWPLTLRHVPDSREAAIVCFADKVVSFNETVEGIIGKVGAAFGRRAV